MQYIGLFIIVAGVIYLTLKYYTQVLSSLKKWVDVTLEGMRVDLEVLFISLSKRNLLLVTFGFPVLLFIIFLLIGGLSAKGIIPGLIFAYIGLKVPSMVTKRLQLMRMNKFNSQLVDGLTLVSNSLKAGFSLIQAFDMLTKEMAPPMSEEFGLVLKENKVGAPLEDALNNLVKRIKSEDLDMVVTSVLIQRKTGGNLTEVFDRIVTTIRDRQIMQGKITSLTAQGKLQGLVIGLMPIILGGIIFAMDPSFMMPMFTQPLGWAMLVVIGILEIVGGLLLKKVTTIDV